MNSGSRRVSALFLAFSIAGCGDGAKSDAGAAIDAGAFDGRSDSGDVDAGEPDAGPDGPPTVRFERPIGGPIFSGAIAIELSAIAEDDRGIAKVVFFVDDVMLAED